MFHFKWLFLLFTRELHAAATSQDPRNAAVHLSHDHAERDDMICYCEYSMTKLIYASMGRSSAASG